MMAECTVCGGWAFIELPIHRTAHTNDCLFVHVTQAVPTMLVLIFPAIAMQCTVTRCGRCFCVPLYPGTKTALQALAGRLHGRSNSDPTVHTVRTIGDAVTHEVLQGDERFRSRMRDHGELSALDASLLTSPRSRIVEVSPRRGSSLAVTLLLEVDRPLMSVAVLGVAKHA